MGNPMTGLLEQTCNQVPSEIVLERPCVADGQYSNTQGLLGSLSMLSNTHFRLRFLSGFRIRRSIKPRAKLPSLDMALLYTALPPHGALITNALYSG
jgi:hypothetical protein